MTCLIYTFSCSEFADVSLETTSVSPILFITLLIKFKYLIIYYLLSEISVYYIFYKMLVGWNQCQGT